MNTCFESLKAHIKVNPPNFGDGESVLTMLCECYNENNPYDNEQILTQNRKFRYGRSRTKGKIPFKYFH